jgi:uncharacterized repeat protein (TIGR01451 family)
MKKRFKKTNRLVMGLMAGLLLLGSAVVFANNSTAFMFNSARPQVVIHLAGVVERNNENVSLEKVDGVKPGETLHWTITSENKGDADAVGYKAVGKIPSGTSFVADSAKAEGAGNVTYSIDGGKSFSKEPMIEEKQSDGSVKLIPAPVSMYSQVRFEWGKSLTSNEKLNASYDVRVK